MAGIFKFTKFALRNLFTKPATRAYPSVPARQTPRTRGAVQVNIDDCIFCGLCNRRCPADAISVDRAAKSWSIKRMSCVQCGNCVLNCPKKCLTMEGAYSAPACEKRSELFRKKESPIPAVHTLAPAPTDGKAIAPDRVLVIDMTSCVLCGLCARRCPTGALSVDRKAGIWTVDRAACLQCGNCVNGCPKKSLALVPENGHPQVETYTRSAAPATSEKTETPITAQPKGEIGITVDLSTCILCGLCVRRCPTSAIAVDRKAGTWSINRQSCVVCGNCLDVCHKHSLSKTTEGIDTSGIQVYAKTVELKAEATSAAPAAKSEPVVEATPVETAPQLPAPAPSSEASATDAPVGNGIAIDMDTCVLCGLCVKKCPTSAITVDRAAKSWSIDREGCVLCGSCITACPKKSLSEAEIPLLKTYTK
ncbi:MAG: 4Fe-4S binding protein [Clostridia bacterium]|nr:4Fe-4S binding protein [Clostridia bacterium]